MRIYNFIIASACALVFFSCKNQEDPSDSDLGYSYYPLSDGDYRIYSVIDTSFEGVGVNVVTRYQIKEEIQEPITVNDETRYQLYVYYKTAGMSDWNSYPDSVWTVFNTNGKIVKVQNNVRFVKLVFPFDIGKKWDGNISDTENDPQKYYEMKEIRRPHTVDSLYFPKTVSVVEYDDKSRINLDYIVSVYAKDYGLVYNEFINYRYKQDNIYDKVEFGRHYTQKLMAHGRYK